jgi:acetyltransferase-like isoleucine patch superfamily enzyme
MYEKSPYGFLEGNRMTFNEYIQKFVKNLLSFREKPDNPKKLSIMYTREFEKYSQYDIGRYTYGEPDIFSWNPKSTLKIGSFCSIAKDVKIMLLDGDHGINLTTTYPFEILWDEKLPRIRYPGNVTIGNDVWIGYGAVIMSNVTIGDGAVIGANSMVTKDIGPYEVHAGNPVTFIRKRFDDDTIQQLLELKWWNFDDEKIRQLLPLMLNKNVHVFISEARKMKDH